LLVYIRECTYTQIKIVLWTSYSFVLKNIVYRFITWMVKCRAIWREQLRHICVLKAHVKFPTAWAPSVFGAVWFCRWVVTHSLCGFQLPWPLYCCLHHTEHPFAFIGRLEQIRLSPAYLENVRLNPSSPVLLTRNGPLQIIDTIVTFAEIKVKFTLALISSKVMLLFAQI